MLCETRKDKRVLLKLVTLHAPLSSSVFVPGDGLLVSKGQKWANMRRMLTPAFHYDILRPYVRVYGECADMLLVRATLIDCQSCSQNSQSKDSWGGHILIPDSPPKESIEH